MASTTNKDIENKVNELDKKVAGLAQRQDEVLIPGIEAIKTQMESLAYVTQKDYIEDRNRDSEDNKIRDAKIADLESLVNAGALKMLNAINSGVGKGITVALIGGALFLIGWSLFKTIPAIGGQ